MSAINESSQQEQYDSKEETKEKKKRPSQSTQLVELCKGINLFHTPDQETFASIPVGDHEETWSLQNKIFRQYLSRRFYETYKTVPISQAIQDSLNVLGGTAIHDGPELSVFTRLAEHNGKIYLDLANDEWQVLEISQEGVGLANDLPIKFRRSRGMLSLPSPILEPDERPLEELKNLLNIATEDHFQLIIGWLLAALNPKGPYPVLVLQGEQGSCKSTTAGLIRALIDPNTTPLRGVPRTTDDLMIAAKNGLVIALDNLSGIPPWLSDDICRLATGGGLSKRELYSNDDEVLLNVKRPVILTGIDDLITRSDLADRSISINLPVIPESRRRTEEEVWKTFRAIAPHILGMLLQSTACALRRLPTIRLERPPRMADFALWVTAGESALGWKKETILNAYRRNQAQSNDTILEHSAITPGIRQLAEKNWCGTASDLLSNLNSLSSAYQDRRSWPANPKVLSDWLRRLSPNLRRIGIEITWRQTAGDHSRKIISIRKVPQTCDAYPTSTHLEGNNAGDCVSDVEGVAERQTDSYGIEGRD